MVQIHSGIELRHDIRLGRHGTPMAIITGGRTLGIAPKANLFLIKAKGSFILKPGDPFKTLGYQFPAIEHVLTNLRHIINSKRAEDSDAKSVVQMSWGKSCYCVCICYTL